MNLPLIPSPWTAALKVVPTWVYVGSGACVVALGALAWASHHGAAGQAHKDAPVIAEAQGQATYSNATAALSGAQLNNTNNRTAAEVRARETADGHIQRVESAADSRAAFSEFISGLHDGVPAGPPAEGAPVPGGPNAPPAPHPAR